MDGNRLSSSIPANDDRFSRSGARQRTIKAAVIRPRFPRPSIGGWLSVAIPVLLASVVIAQSPIPISNELPAVATTQLTRSLTEAKTYPKHVWRDTPPINDDGTVNGYVEISRGDRRKWEFRMGSNARAIDRMIPEQIGGYPVNYGFVPQTISYDGDPFDMLVLGPPIPGGRMVRGVIVGLMLMEDEKGNDAKVVISLLAKGRPAHSLTESDRATIGDYFSRYKLLETDKFSSVPGWGSIADGLAFVNVTHAFFQECRQVSGPTCRIAAR
jgi:inorganic pyrophosphatase